MEDRVDLLYPNNRTIGCFLHSNFIKKARSATSRETNIYSSCAVYLLLIVHMQNFAVMLKGFSLSANDL